MSFSSTPRLPISQILGDTANDTVTDEEPKKKSREDWRKAKELEEMRKAGTAPAAVDEEGRDINPHIPQYISNAPWYYNSAGPTLKHQRPQDETKTILSGMEEWYKRGVDTSKTITKWRKGACDNCGAMGHARKECFEKPRKVLAKFSGQVRTHDDFVQPNIVYDYDGKRDRWSGYDPTAHREIIEEYQKVEEAKQKIKAEKLKDQTNDEEGGGTGLDEEDDDEEEDGDKYADGADMPGTKVDSKQRITVRNLRIREDTAKYLRNLDPNSAYYDPKTRSMRDNPVPANNPDETDFAGENFVRYSGDTNKHSTAQLFAWEAHGKGVDVHLLAEPTKLELLQKEYDKKKDEFKANIKGTVLERYGGEEHLKVPPRSLLLAQTEEYVEYSRTGKVLKGNEKQTNRSRYEEDVYGTNHTSVWGSFWCAGQWGYHCCNSFIKNSYCVGENGKADAPAPSASTSAGHEQLGLHDAEPDSRPNVVERSDDEESAESDVPESEPKKKKKKKKNKKHKKNKSKDKEKTALEKALEAEEEHNKKVDRMMQLGERKRPYNSMFEAKAPTEEEVEAYLMKRRRDEDPMFMNQ